VYCYQGDIDEGLSDYNDNSFDYVILNQTLQSTKRPDFVLHETLRIGKKTIISFPNFAYYITRVQLLCRGTMPKNPLLPYEWYETPNIHLITIKDFRRFCEDRAYPIEKEIFFCISPQGKSVTRDVIPNLRAQYGFFVLDGTGVTGDGRS
jgi:methionine biosynthesis protein MetW